jgi:hypothetical protein
MTGTWPEQSFLKRQGAQTQNSIPDNAGPSHNRNQRDGDERHGPDAFEKRFGVGCHNHSLNLRIEQGDDQLATISDAKLSVDAADVLLDRSFTNAQLVCDCFVRYAAANQRSDFLFSGSQSAEMCRAGCRVQGRHLSTFRITHY